LNPTTIRRPVRRSQPGEPAARRASERGQSLVELSLMLPMLLLLTVVALDFGRVYLGYINVQNMARIAANLAANNPEAWSTTLDEGVQVRYRNEILEDATQTNCELPVVGGEPVIPDPVFTDTNGDGTTTGLGDRVTVAISCQFAVATPLIANIIGGSIDVTAESDFPVKAGMTSVVVAGSTGGTPPPTNTSPPAAAFIANSTIASTDSSPVITVLGPTVTVSFRDSSGGGAATSWAWDFGDSVTATTQDAAHEYTCTSPDAFGWCAFLVQFTAANAYGSSTDYMSVLVRSNSDINFTASAQVISRGEAVTFTDASTAGGTDYAWTFGTGEGSSSGAATSVTHTYNTAGTFTVSLTVTYPDPVGVAPITIKTGFITVTAGYCTVPSLNNVRFNDADAVWRGAPYNFTGTVRRATGAPSGNFKITAQSITAGNGATAICSSDVYVSAP
jgi:PKD repeat protein